MPVTICAQVPRSLLVAGTTLVLVACGSSGQDVVRAPSAPASGAASTPTTSSPAPSTSPAGTHPAGHPSLEVTPHARLRNGQSVLVRATGFTPEQQYTVIECAQKGDKTGPGDCDLPSMLTVTSDQAGVVQTRVRVVKGPFGANRIVCSARQRCLISVTQASLSPTEEADREISFAP